MEQTSFDLGWDFVSKHYYRIEDSRQLDQIKQALRSHKQNIVEGSAERSLSSKLKLYDVAKASGMEALEDFEDILRLEGLPRWSKDDPRLKKLRQIFEGYPSYPSNSPTPPRPSVKAVREVCGYLLDRQINAVEEKHQREGGYNENLLKKRLKYKRSSIL